jgi:uncharacterized protein (DUF4213/DUF364 family)
MSDLTIDAVKARWNDVLDAVLDRDRIAWLAFFDARIVSVSDRVITISFADVVKLGGDHNFSMARNPKHLALLQEEIAHVFGAPFEVHEI